MNYKEEIILDTFINKRGDLSIDKLSISNNILYYQGVIKHEFAKNEDDIIFIKIDIACKKQYIKLITYCLKNGIREDKILLLSDIFPEKSNIIFDVYHTNNMICMLETYIQEENYYKFKKMNFNLIKCLSVYIKYYDLYDLFKEFCKTTLEKKFTGMEYKYAHYYSFPTKKEWIIENDEIRNSIINIHRKVKIYLMLEKEKESND